MMKLFQNKKAQGQWSTFQKFTVAAILIVILYFIARGQLFGADDHFTKIRMSATNDFDGDGFRDSLDDAPCTFGDMKVIQKGEKDVYYPVQRPVDAESGTGDCPTKDDEASTLTCTDQTYEGKALKCVLDRETEETYCALTLKDCNDMLAEEYARINSE